MHNEVANPHKPMIMLTTLAVIISNHDVLTREHLRLYNCDPETLFQPDDILLEKMVDVKLFFHTNI
jgi:hypothetical protein